MSVFSPYNRGYAIDCFLFSVGFLVFIFVVFHVKQSQAMLHSGKRKAPYCGRLVSCYMEAHLQGPSLYIATIIYPKTKMKAAMATTGAKITAVATIVSMI